MDDHGSEVSFAGVLLTFFGLLVGACVLAGYLAGNSVLTFEAVFRDCMNFPVGLAVWIDLPAIVEPGPGGYFALRMWIGWGIYLALLGVGLVSRTRSGNRGWLLAYVLMLMATVGGWLYRF